MAETTEFEGDRVYLMLLDEDHIDDEYVSWHENREETKYYSSSGKEFTRDFLLSEMREGRESGTLFVYGIFSRENRKLIGNVKIGPISTTHATSDLVVFVGDTDYLGKGIATEAIGVANKIAFDTLGMRKLFGGMFRSNVGSVKAYLRADWVIEGVLHDHYLVDGEPEDRILVACFNRRDFDAAEHHGKYLSFDDVYGA